MWPEFLHPAPAVPRGGPTLSFIFVPAFRKPICAFLSSLPENSTAFDVQVAEIGEVDVGVLSSGELGMDCQHGPIQRLKRRFWFMPASDK